MMLEERWCRARHMAISHVRLLMLSVLRSNRSHKRLARRPQSQLAHLGVIRNFCMWMFKIAGRTPGCFHGAGPDMRLRERVIFEKRHSGNRVRVLHASFRASISVTQLSQTTSSEDRADCHQGCPFLALSSNTQGRARSSVRRQSSFSVPREAVSGM